jgi:uncharacterized protein (DUF885 family)
MARLMAVCLMLFLAGCARKPEERFAKLANEFVLTTLAFSPVAATAAGLHEFQGRNLDEMLDDISPAGYERQRRFYADFRARLEKEVRRDALPPEDQADYDILTGQMALALMELDEIQSQLHNPTYYVELAGNALFTPYVVEYAPPEARARHIVARLRQLPVFLDQAKINLVSAAPIWTEVALQENAGNVKLVEQTLRGIMRGNTGEEYGVVSPAALDALRRFDEFLRGKLAQRGDWDWRLGPEKYAKKFRYALAADVDPDFVLRSAMADLEAVRSRMLDLSLDLEQVRQRPAASDTKGQNAVIRAALEHAAARHATPDSYVPEARGDLAEALAFVRQKGLLTLPGGGNLRVIETPEFMRGIYAVGGFNPAPPLQPQLGAFYWITPLPADWPRARVESKLREYNFYKLKLLTMHEAIPGHAAQFAYANRLEPAGRRLLRSVYGNGPYVEGWAQYATQMMLDEGFLGNSRELRLTFYKERMRVLADAILDIRLHTAGMTDQEALEFIERDTFQEAEEAQAKLQRAKLSSCQLPAYYIGWKGWDQARDEYRRMKGAQFGLAQFNDAALQEGAVPLPLLRGLLRGR